MEKIINKRKIKNKKTLEGKRIHKKKENKEQICQEEPKEQISPFVQVNVQKSKNLSKVNPFQLVVIKVPWYKKAIRSLFNWFGFGYYYE